MILETVKCHTERVYESKDRLLDNDVTRVLGPYFLLQRPVCLQVLT